MPIITSVYVNNASYVTIKRAPFLYTQIRRAIKKVPSVYKLGKGNRLPVSSA